MELGRSSCSEREGSQSITEYEQTACDYDRACTHYKLVREEPRGSNISLLEWEGVCVSGEGFMSESPDRKRMQIVGLEVHPVIMLRIHVKSVDEIGNLAKEPHDAGLLPYKVVDSIYSNDLLWFGVDPSEHGMREE